MAKKTKMIQPDRVVDTPSMIFVYTATKLEHPKMVDRSETSVTLRDDASDKYIELDLSCLGRNLHTLHIFSAYRSRYAWAAVILRAKQVKSLLGA